MRHPPRCSNGFVLAAVLALGLAVLLPRIARATYIPSERIPTSSPVYRDLERLADTFASAPQFLSMRPLRVAEAGAFLDALAAAHPDAASDPAYRRARRELDPGWSEATRPFLYRV